jgi:hypothetical protein
MRRRRWHRLRALAAVTAAMLLVAGCAATSVADTVTAGAPDGVALDPLAAGPQAVWIEPGERFAVVTWGSSSCPAVASQLVVETASRLLLTFAESSDGACTADLAATTHEFVLPDGITEAPVTITVSFEGGVQNDQLVLE